ncbi:MAG: hypothetical protein H3C43_00670 [Leptonema sp. (in: Bacteria)]|nr:hypothetical protein [Leptonema sp. (in: bacteria)]
MQRWSDLPEKIKKEIERKYRSGKSPVILGPEYGLKPKQISDQAYRKSWIQTKSSKKTKSAKKSTKKVKKVEKKTTKRSVKKRSK